MKRKKGKEGRKDGEKKKKKKKAQSIKYLQKIQRTLRFNYRRINCLSYLPLSRLGLPHCLYRHSNLMQTKKKQDGVVVIKTLTF